MSHDHQGKKVNFSPFVWFLMGSGFSLVLLLGGCGLSSFQIPGKSSNVLKTSLTSSSNEAEVVKQLIGQWKLVSIDGAMMPSSLFFTEDKVVLEGTSENQATELGYYSVESDARVNYLFLSETNDETPNRVLSAIFDFPGQDQLRLENMMSDTSPNFRPETPLEFSDEAVVYEKVSNVISDSLEITSMDEQARLYRQIQGRNNIGAVNRAQQVFYLEQGQFSDSLQDLGIGLPLETDDYFYKTVSIEPNRIVTMAAQSKKSDLNSWIGIVYVSDLGTSQILCESNEPTMNLPPQAPFNPDRRVTCPEGYSEL